MVLNSPCFTIKSWLVQDQTVPELAIPEQTATGKGTSNPLMAGSLPKTIKPTLSYLKSLKRAMVSVRISTETNGVIKVSLPPKTAEENFTSERERKAKDYITLLIALLPEDHLAKFTK
ncbi:hypothetical protein Tco_1033806 [Tanacetum coccineum]